MFLFHKPSQTHIFTAGSLIPDWWVWQHQATMLDHVGIYTVMVKSLSIPCTQRSLGDHIPYYGSPKLRHQRTHQFLRQYTVRNWTTAVHMAMCQNLVPLVNIKTGGKWMFIPLKMVLIGIEPYPYLYLPYIHLSMKKKTCFRVFKSSLVR